jgi:hypothetical protein
MGVIWMFASWHRRVDAQLTLDRSVGEATRRVRDAAGQITDFNRTIERLRIAAGVAFAAGRFELGHSLVRAGRVAAAFQDARRIALPGLALPNVLTVDPWRRTADADQLGPHPLVPTLNQWIVWGRAGRLSSSASVFYRGDTHGTRPRKTEGNSEDWNVKWGASPD